MAIRKSHQGRGLGAKLISKLEIFAKEKKLTKIFLNSREKSVKFYGMASSTALEKYYSDNMKIDYKASEGKLVNISYKGALEDTLLDLLGGVRSTCTYIGAKKIKDISKCTTFVCVNNQLNNYFN